MFGIEPQSSTERTEKIIPENEITPEDLPAW